MKYFTELKGRPQYFGRLTGGGGGAKIFWDILSQKCALTLCHDCTMGEGGVRCHDNFLGV